MEKLITLLAILSFLSGCILISANVYNALIIRLLFRLLGIATCSISMIVILLQLKLF